MSGYEHSSQPYAQYQQGPPYVQAVPPTQGYPYAQSMAPQQNVYRQDPYPDLQPPSSYANTSQYAAQPPQAQGPYPAPPQTHPAFHSPTPAAPAKHGPVVFLFTHNETILNCQVDDPFGRTPFTITTEKKVTSFKASDGNTVARIEWDHSSPVMMYKGEKVKCREWLRVIHDKARGVQGKAFAHQGKEYVATVPEKKTVAWIAVDRPDCPVAVLRAFGDDAGLEVFPDVFHVPGLLEDLLLATVMICSKKSLGDDNSIHWGSNLFRDVLLSAVAG